MEREDLRRVEKLFLGKEHPDDVLDALLPYVRQNSRTVAALRALPLGEVSNALVLAAGGRK
ncbi:hypothetical protein [Pseudonocardia alaniniphila]|uniref:Uncharacterized protein n=1 Tax=Pseudonocardia alaniniphila TaxID=75291 RepID=A0ABS9TNZ3_9PSEU|nr:hypothetical protein [Pseudonocardia alaniniphila]MCH6170257.1 hypothetical protein [Pseudonocardia alaniniphila]